MAATAVCARSEQIGEDFRLVHKGSESRFKRGRQKTVTWPIDQKICEVRHFLVDDAPSFLGAAYQNHNLCKQASSLSGFHVSGTTKRVRLELNNHAMDVPPGFGHDPSTATKLCQWNAQLNASMVVTSPWHCPPKFLVDASWLWAGGEESLEVALQQQRERRFFEAFYPRFASIPDSPLEPSHEPSKEADEALVAEIPLVSLEEEEMENEDTEQESISIVRECAALRMSEHREMADVHLPSNDISHSAPLKKQRQSVISMADSNIAAAAAAACMVVKALGESDLVDEKLLLEILKNPSLLKSLTCSSSFMKDKYQEQDNITASSSRQVAYQEPSSRKLPTEYGACMNRSPVSVLEEWGESVRMHNLHRMAPNVNGSAHVQQSTNSSPISMNWLSPASLPSPYPCSKPESSSRGFVQKGIECMPRVPIPEIPEMNTYSRNEASLKHVNGPRDSQNGPSKDSYTCMPAAVTTSPPFCVHPTPLLTKDLPQRNSTQGGPPKYRPAEDSLLARKSSAHSLVPKTGGRTQRSCMYFNSPRGCRKGENCAFTHQVSGTNTMDQ